MVQMPYALARRLKWVMLDGPGKKQRTKGVEQKREKRVALEWGIRQRYGSQLGREAFRWTDACTPALVRTVSGLHATLHRKLAYVVLNVLKTNNQTPRRDTAV